MSIQNQVVTTQIPFNNIKVQKTDQNRSTDTDTDHVTNLTADIRSNGLLDPISVYELKDPQGNPTGIYSVVDGHHRYKAIEKLREAQGIQNPSNPWHNVKVKVLTFKDESSRISYGFDANAHAGKVHRKHELSDAIEAVTSIAKQGYFGKLVTDAKGNRRPGKSKKAHEAFKKAIDSWTLVHMSKATTFNSSHRYTVVQEVLENFGIKDPDKVNVPTQGQIFDFIESQIPKWDGRRKSGDLSTDKQHLVYHMTDSLIADGPGRILQKLVSKEGLGTGPWTGKLPEISIVFTAHKTQNKKDSKSLDAIRKKAEKQCDSVNKLYNNKLLPFKINKIWFVPQKRKEKGPKSITF